FLKPIICCCRELMDDESVNKDDLARDLEDLHQRIKNIQQGNHPIDIIIRAWFDLHISRLGEFKNGLKDFEKLYRWLRYCYDTRDKEIVHFFVFFEINRDEEMREVVFDQQGHVHEFFQNPKSPGHVYLEK